MAKKLVETKGYLIYKHVSPEGKYYVGLTCLNCGDRWGKNGANYVKKNKDGGLIHPYFANAILKYGWDNFQHIIVDSCLSKEEADLLETSLIQEAKELGISYNIAPGGIGGREPGFHHNESTKAAISEKLSGRTLSDEQKLLISNSLKGRSLSLSHKQKIGESNKGKRSIKVLMYSKEGEYLRSFNSLTEAAEYLNKTPGHISKCCKGARKTAYGYIWKYEESN